MIKSKMHKMAAFNKKKYLLVSTLSTSSILVLLLKLNRVNLYQKVNQKYHTMILLQEAILSRNTVWSYTKEPG